MCEWGGRLYTTTRGASCAQPDGTTSNMLTVSATWVADVLVVAVLAYQHNNVLSVVACFINDISLLQGMLRFVDANKRAPSHIASAPWWWLLGTSRSRWLVGWLGQLRVRPPAACMASSASLRV